MDTQATFFTTLIDEWVRAGVTDAVVCPGNRSTMLSALLAMDDRIQLHVIVDERSAAFFALGIGKATGMPAVFWCTSGTATSQAHAAVIEAHYAQVPLLVCTANRPAEAQHVRDWQSIDQSKLYDGMTRWHFEPGVADDAMRSSWRSIASRSVAETINNPHGPGPVHLDLAIREPWSLEVGELPEGRVGGLPWHSHHRPSADTHVNGISAITRGAKRGVFVVGESSVNSATLHECASALGWPVLAEARSGCRTNHPSVVSAYDAIVRTPAFTGPLGPELIVRIGTPPISKAVANWVLDSGAPEWFVDPYDIWNGSASSSELVIQADPTEFCAAISAAELVTVEPEWLAAWQDAEAKAQAAFDSVLTNDTPTEPAVARTLARNLPSQSVLFAATSMPVRDVESFSSTALKASVVANRGASGMEGLISTAAGIHWGSARQTVLLVGDLSFLYDLNALWALNGTADPVNLTIVVVDNNGGGIFSTLPQLNGIDKDLFERVVATPQSVDIAKVAASLNIHCEQVGKMSDFMNAVDAAQASDGISMVYVKTNRIDNAALHKTLNEAVAKALI